MLPTIGLIFAGGGACAAWQVGLLAAIGRMRRQAGADQGHPFPVNSGTSAAAINAAFLARSADRFDAAIAELVGVWKHDQAKHLYRSDILGLIRSGARWTSLLALGWLITQKRIRPESLLDNDPLNALLAKHINLERLPVLMEAGHLRALAITASSYSTGEHVTFYDSRHAVKPWVRNQRLAQHDRVSHAHLLASSASPYISPAMRLEGPQGCAIFGDGSCAQQRPVHPSASDSMALDHPSQCLGVIATRHAEGLTHTVISLLRILGASLTSLQGQGNALVSYLLFESAYTRELMALGEAIVKRSTQGLTQAQCVTKKKRLDLHLSA